MSRTATVAFTFSEAMDPDQTDAQFMNATTFQPYNPTPAWNVGNTVLSYTPEGGSWPANTNIQWFVSGANAAGDPLDFLGGLLPLGTFTTGSGGGTTDTTPPVLVSSSPTNNAAGVPLNRSIRFNFNEAMQASQLIQWSANLTETNFAYSWSGDARTLTCAYSNGLPTNASITWKLNPGGSPALFKDTAGNALAADIYAGSFTTSNTNDLCNTDPGDTSLGSFSLSREVSYVQTGTGAPIEDTNNAALFAAALSSPTNNNPVTSAQLAVPSGSPPLTFTSFGRLFFSFDEYASQALLDAGRPPGNYTLQVSRTTSGQQSVTLTTQAGDWPPIPQILNLTALQSADATSDVVVQWNGFTGAGEGDSIHFFIPLGNNLFFEAPDPCVPIALDKTATSITVPKGTLIAGRTYDATLTYSHFGPFDTNTIPDIPAFASASKSLNFKIVTGGGGVPPKSPTIGSPSLAGNQLQFQVTGASPGQSIQLQESTTPQPGSSWLTIQTVPADASGTADFTIPITSIGSRFYRLFTP